ncbi:MAG: hemolysin family protein [Ardenticatenaceae bacterium]
MDVESLWAAAVVFMAALLLIIMLAAAEAALSTISHSRMRRLIAQGVSRAEIALRLIEDFPRLRASLSLLNMLLVAIATGAGLVAAGLSYQRVVPIVMAVTLTILLFQMLAAAVGARRYQRVTLMLAPVVNAVWWLLTPLRAFRNSLRRRLANSLQLQEVARRTDDEGMRALASVVGEEEAHIPEDEREMIYNVVTLGQTTVREVMVPRPDLVALEANTSMMEALSTVIDAGHSRIPVYKEHIDEIIGILYAKDLLGYLRDGRTDLPIREVLRPALFVPTSKMADELLEELQGKRVHLAIVFDEYGGTAGLVTIEDILEEIVGEIRDEYDSEEDPFVRKNKYEAIVSGRYDIHDLNREMGLELPTDENDTVGGLIYSALGRVPQVGHEARLEEAHVTFRVMKMAARRILSVRVMVDRPSPGNGTPDKKEQTQPKTEPRRTRSGKLKVGFSL